MNSNETLKIRFQCPSVKTKTVGTFLTGCDTGYQYTNTYNSAYDLFLSNEYKELKNRVKPTFNNSILNKTV